MEKQLEDQIDQSEKQAGRAFKLSSSFTWGPRWYSKKKRDARCIVTNFGKPDLFITMTANPNWREIRQELKPGQNVILKIFSTFYMSGLTAQT